MKLADLAGKRVALWGAGRETRSVVGAMSRLGIDAQLCFVDDAPTGTDLIDGIEVFRGDAKDNAMAAADVIVRTPSISRYRDDVTALHKSGKQLTTATQLWFAEGFTNVIGVTGTKGKSTTASLIAAILRASGLNVFLTGNIGRAPIDLLGTEPDLNDKWWVVELSSYQTSDLNQSPPIGVLTSLSAEHLDWHGNEATYIKDKLNLFAHAREAQIIVNSADAGASAAIPQINANVIRSGQPPAAYIDSGFFKVDAVTIAPTNAMQLLGRHNRELACLALSVLPLVEVDIAQYGDSVAHALTSFEALPHRLQIIDEIDGVTYVNDSLSTTPAATLAALQSFEGQVVSVLVGGYDRGLSYDELARYVTHANGRVKVIALPDSGARIAQSLTTAGDITAVEAVGVLQAVQYAAENAGDKEVVLLSPGAPSFGHFRDYVERGNAFNSAVASLKALTS